MLENPTKKKDGMRYRSLGTKRLEVGSADNPASYMLSGLLLSQVFRRKLRKKSLKLPV